MTRAAELTRADLLDAAVSVFAEKGFAAGSIRDICGPANANPAAISYHFGGKDGLYRAVLRHSIDAFDIPSFDPDAIATMPRDEAVRRFLSAQLSAIRRSDELARYFRIFAWESLAPTDVFTDFLKHERLPILEIGRALIDRFLAEASDEDRAVALVWLLHQAEPFTRDPKRLTALPLGLKYGRDLEVRLTERLTTLVIAGLEALETATSRTRSRTTACR